MLQHYLWTWIFQSMSATTPFLCFSSSFLNWPLLLSHCRYILTSSSAESKSSVFYPSLSITGLISFNSSVFYPSSLSITCLTSSNSFYCINGLASNPSVFSLLLLMGSGFIWLPYRIQKFIINISPLPQFTTILQNWGKVIIQVFK